MKIIIIIVVVIIIMIIIIITTMIIITIIIITISCYENIIIYSTGFVKAETFKYVTDIDIAFKALGLMFVVR